MCIILLERAACGKPPNGYPKPHDCEIGLTARTCRCGGLPGRYEENWFRDLDSNQDTQLQRLMSYQLDDPGMAGRNCSRGMQACTDSGDGLSWPNNPVTP